MPVRNIDAAMREMLYEMFRWYMDMYRGDKFESYFTRVAPDDRGCKVCHELIEGPFTVHIESRKHIENLAVKHQYWFRSQEFRGIQYWWAEGGDYLWFNHYAGCCGYEVAEAPRFGSEKPKGWSYCSRNWRYCSCRLL